VSAAEAPETIHDFYGFPQELYRINYPARGAPDLARKVTDLLGKAGINCDTDRFRGLDHGAWVPMRVMYSKAEMPVTQLSIQHHLDTAKHFDLGQAIEPLRHDGILIVGSGGAVHPLGYFDPPRPGATTAKWAVEFEAWLTNAVTRGDRESLIGYRTLAPFPERAHPRPDHYMPLMAAMGAAGPDARGKLIHHSWEWGTLGMGAYEFQPVGG
jgi:4,5-DOPA dioxygenase extradiol